MNELLNALPHYSPWPARLLGLEKWTAKEKTTAELTREFEYEKWGPLWEIVRKSPVMLGVEDIEKLAFDDRSEIICWCENDLRLMSARIARKLQLSLIASTIGKLQPASSIVEVGAGYGSVIVNLAIAREFQSANFVATEYTEAGLKLIEYLAKIHDRPIRIGHCDLSATSILSVEIQARSLLFTSYAAHYIPRYDKGLIDRLLALRPACVVHFEPFYEHCDEATLLGLMQQRYIRVNDYNQNLMSIIRDEANCGRLELMMEQKQVFGMNPLLPMSIVAWRPC